MKILRQEHLIDIGGFSSSNQWEIIDRHIKQAIYSVEWPVGSGSFTLFDEPGKGRGKGNGVKPIKEACMRQLKTLGWSLETSLDIATLKRPGPIDATYKVNDRYFCLEWETGNISSSHRALNKISLGMLKDVLIGGALILPTREMYKYLTDRVGNFLELEPYFPLWGSLRINEGLLVVVAIEHDSVSWSVPRIPKGTDGRAIV
jgi:hypothetical protein